MESPTKPNELAPAYDPSAVEREWYARWEAAGVFRAPLEGAGEAFVITLPPPNVTGVLHMGHVLNHTLQDLLIRWKRMEGVPALFLPGTDHAGIATQNMVKKKLAAEGTDWQALGREAFVAETWRWKERCEATILEQMKRLGESCDWSRYCFTLDAGLSAAVTEVFVSLHERGLIYRGKRLINWCPVCRTALSDEEVEHEDVSGNLYHVAYAVIGDDGADARGADGELETITIATTRPETILGDTGVAVHPEDERYARFIGKTVRLPVLDRAIPVVADASVDREFGTGALKVTPGHDPVDFEIGQRHGLPAIEMMSESGTVTDVGGPYTGMDRFVARKAIVRDLEASARLKKVETHRRPVGHCYRCRTIVEPILSTQWFVRMQPLAEPAIAAVRDGRVRIEPERWEKVYFHWMENIRDWCISRQLWWGHRIPVWYCDGAAARPECAQPIVARSAPAACPHCGSAKLTQDADVLDTWFSSWLWPFSTLGWPERTPDLARFFPGDVLVTGSEILFFWVARMIMASLAFMDDVPFSRVLIHGIVRDEKGRKMSKTLGNSPDPIALMDRVGADALRFSIVYTTPAGQDVLYSEKSLEMGRHLANKIWNAARLILSREFTADAGAVLALHGGAVLRVEDRWILARARATVASVTADLGALRPSEAMATLYDFFWHEFCDWYLELAKRRTEGADGEVSTAVLRRVMRASLALFHPVMPFVTEEVASRFAGGDRMLATGPWPREEEFPGDAQAESEFDLVRRVITAIRMLRSESNVPPGAQVAALVRPESPRERSVLAREAETIRVLAKVSDLDLDYAQETLKKALTAVVLGAQVFLPVEGLVDLEKEKGRLGKEITRLGRELVNVRAKLTKESFLEKAPEDVVRAEREKERRFAEKLSALERNLEMLAD
ncbi:MAG: valine--tRNA ligase [bacterium]